MFRLVFPLLLVPLVTGCAAVAAAGVAGLGLVQYSRNEVEMDVPMDLDSCWGASHEALRRLGALEPEVERGITEGRLGHEDLLVRVERHPEGFTRIRVRAGTFHTANNERRARLVLQEIGRVLDEEDQLRAWAERVKGEAPGS